MTVINDGTYVLREMQLVVNGKCPMGMTLGRNSKAYLKDASDEGIYTDPNGTGKLETRKLWYMECDAKPTRGSDGNAIPRGSCPFPLQIDFETFRGLGRPGIIEAVDGDLKNVGDLEAGILENEKFESIPMSDEVYQTPASSEYSL